MMLSLMIYLSIFVAVVVVIVDLVLPIFGASKNLIRNSTILQLIRNSTVCNSTIFKTKRENS